MKYDAWIIPDTPAAPPKAMLDANYSPLLAALLASRGFSTPEAARRYLDCGAEVLSDPMLMADMPAAANRIRRAIEEKEHVAVYGDYDVDGITSTALLTSWLRSRGLDAEQYIPDRIEEGYGLNVAAIERLYRRGVRLLITVDCGVTALAEAEAAAALGMDMIVTDHHECQAELPNCAAVVDPKRPDCCGSKSLAGVGVAFKLICAVENDPLAVLNQWGDFVAIGTVADVMPLTGENRFIVQYGLRRIAEQPRPGMTALLNECGPIKMPLHAMSISFTLAPRLNAAGRLGKAKLAVDLLLCEDEAECAELARSLCSLNRERQLLEQTIWQEAVEILEKQPPDGPIVLSSERWHQGVVGIAASRLSDAYSLPAIMICLDGDKGKGSCRSFGGFNLFEALSACSELLESYGGHALAAGLNIRRENIAAFREAVTEYYRAHPGDQKNLLPIDLCVCDSGLLEMECIEALETLEPCGCGNPRVICCFKNALLESVTPIGGGKHLRLRVQRFSKSYTCIYFSQTEENLGVRAGDIVDLAFCPQINDFRGHRSVQLLVEDIRPSDYRSLCRDVLTDAPLSALDRDLLLPQRADFVCVWKRLQQLGGEVSDETEALLRRISSCRHPAMISVCLKVFAEAKLADVRLEGDTLRVSLHKNCPKTDLESMPLMQRLRAL